jgi:hypothetical protein
MSITITALEFLSPDSSLEFKEASLWRISQATEPMSGVVLIPWNADPGVAFTEDKIGRIALKADARQTPKVFLDVDAKTLLGRCSNNDALIEIFADGKGAVEAVLHIFELGVDVFRQRVKPTEITGYDILLTDVKVYGNGTQVLYEIFDN